MKPETMKKIQTFMKECDSSYLTWDTGIFTEYIEWIAAHAGLGIIWRQGEIVGVGIARTLDLLHLNEQWKDHYAISPNGDVVFVDEICAVESKAIPVLWEMMRNVFGPRKFFAGKRHGKLKIWEFNKYQKKILKG